MRIGLCVTGTPVCFAHTHAACRKTYDDPKEEERGGRSLPRGASSMGQHSPTHVKSAYMGRPFFEPPIPNGDQGFS